MSVRKQDSVAIYDLSKQENHLVSLSLRRLCHSRTELFQALRLTPADVCAQLVLWSDPYWLSDQGLAGAMVSRLDIKSQFLHDLGNYHLPAIGFREREPFRRSQIGSIVGHGVIATISQNHAPAPPGVSDGIPILLVASPIGHRRTGEATFEDSLAAIVAEFDQGSSSIRRPKDPQVGRLESDHRKVEQLYALVVENFIKEDRSAAPSEAYLLLAAVSPLLYIEAHMVRIASDHLRDTYSALMIGEEFARPNLDTNLMRLNRELDRARLHLRRTLERVEDHVSQMFRYLGAELDIDCSRNISYASIKEDWRCLADETRRVEAEVRDYMQLQVGNLSLEESRRSIELSNLQIREAKSGRFCLVKCLQYSH